MEGFVRPLVLTPGYPTIKIPLELNCTRLHCLGQVTMPGGFPPSGRTGESIGSYTLRYSGGKVREIPLRSGIEVARANLVYVATRIDPVASAAQRALCLVKNWAREQYQVLLFSVPVENGRLESLTAQLIGQDMPLLLFAITAEQSS
jgi:hypothetical protein